MKRPYSLEGIVASVLFIGLFLVVLLQVVGRTGLVAGPIWTEELARWLWVWMAFIAIAEVERTDRQLNMRFVVDVLPFSVKRIIFTIIDLVYLGIASHLVWIGYWAVIRTSRNETVTLPTTDAVLYASAMVAMVLIVYRILNRLISRFREPDVEQVS